MKPKRKYNVVPNIPERLEALESRQAELHEAMADPTFYQQDREKIVEVNTELESVDGELAEIEKRKKSGEDQHGKAKSVPPVTDEVPKANHPFFWAGYVLVDSGIAPKKPASEPPAAQPALNGQQPGGPDSRPGNPALPGPPAPAR